MMDEAGDTSLSKDKQRLILPDDEANQAAVDVAGLSEYPSHRTMDLVILTRHSLTRRVRHATHQSPIRFSQISLTKAQTANDRLLIGHSTSENLRTDAGKLRAAFELIAQVESDDCMCA